MFLSCATISSFNIIPGLVVSHVLNSHAVSGSFDITGVIVLQLKEVGVQDAETFPLNSTKDDSVLFNRAP